jgi:thiol reductant ABC exporter CydC subunit
VAQAVGLSVVSQLSATALLAVSAWLLSRAAEHPTASALTLGAVAVRTLSITRALSRYGERLVSHDAALRRTADLRVAAYSALRRRPPAQSAEALGTVLTDVDAAQDLLLRTRLPALSALVVTTACAGVVAVLLPAALPLVLGGLLLALVAVPLLAVHAGRGEVVLAERRGALQVSAVELLRAGAELTVLGQDQHRLAAAARRGAQLAQVERRAAWRAVAPAAVAGAVQALVAAGVVLLGAEAVQAGRLARVDLAVVVLVSLAAFEPLAALRDAASRLPGLLGPVRRLAALLAVPAVPDSHPSSVGFVGVPLRDPPTNPTELRLVGAGLDVPALRDLDLRVVPGRSVALVGPSGSGKTTFLGLLAGRIAPDRGAALAGDVPVATLDEVVRSRLVVVAEQQPFLFTASLRDNLRVARPEATDEQLTGSLEVVGLGPWLRGLPDGLGTPVGELGTQLSGGQRTRVGVARALLSPAPLVLLDEPTEGLSPVEGAALVRAVLSACAERGLVLVTHRPEELEGVDEVIHLAGGRLVSPPVTA